MKILINTFHQYKYYFLSFLIIGIIIYSPMFFNGFVWDDWNGILNNTQIHQFNFPILYDNIFNTQAIYRQTVAIYNSLLYSLFGTNAFPYHFIQLVLHIITTSLLFIFFIHYFKKYIAYILSLIFLIHPINAEAVLWISAAESQLFSIPGIIALIILSRKTISDKQLFITGGLLLLSLISYELGIFYSIAAILLLIINKSKKRKKFFLIITGMLILYCFLRFIGNATSIPMINFNLPGATIEERILSFPSIIVYYFKTLILPMDLMIWQNWIIQKYSFKEVLLPSIVIIGILFFFIKYLITLQEKRKGTLLFFSLWLGLGLLSVSHIFPLDMTVSDRWFYFAFIGFLGMIGYFIQYYDTSIIKYKKYLLLIFIPVLLVYSVRTFYRSFDWKDNITLYTHDLQMQQDNKYLNYSLGTLYNEKGESQKAIIYLEKVAEVTPEFRFVLVELGLAYESQQNYEKAAYYYNRAKYETKDPLESDLFDINFLLARSLHNTGKYREIIKLLDDQIIENSSNPFLLLYIRADAWYKLQNYEKAMKDAQILYENISDPIAIKLYEDIKEKIAELN